VKAIQFLYWTHGFFDPIEKPGAARSTSTIINEGQSMNTETKQSMLKIALAAFGVIFMLVYPLGLVWPSGWVWHAGQGTYYLQMICTIYAVLGVYLIIASRNPAQHCSLISFTIWSSAAHAAVMAVQAVRDGHEMGHLIGDVPALFLVAIVLGYLSSGASANQN
jgi:hypothetical protein